MSNDSSYIRMFVDERENDVQRKAQDQVGILVLLVYSDLLNAPLKVQ